MPVFQNRLATFDTRMLAVSRAFEIQMTNTRIRAYRITHALVATSVRQREPTVDRTDSTRKEMKGLSTSAYGEYILYYANALVFKTRISADTRRQHVPRTNIYRRFNER